MTWFLGVLSYSSRRVSFGRNHGRGGRSRRDCVRAATGSIVHYAAFAFLILAMLIIGGSGCVSGAAIGAIAVAMSQEGLRQVENWVNIERSEGTWVKDVVPFQLVGFTEIVIAIAIILVLIVRPSGITGGREIAIPRLGGRRGLSRPDEPATPSSRLEPTINPSS